MVKKKQKFVSFYSIGIERRKNTANETNVTERRIISSDIYMYVCKCVCMREREWE